MPDGEGRRKSAGDENEHAEGALEQPAHRAAVERYVTQARLGPYLAEVGDDYSRAEELYVWNLRASGAFHEVLGVFEVVLRNALCEELRR